MLFCCQTKPARGGEVERARVSGDLSDYTGELAAFKALFQCKQSILGCPCLDTDHSLTPFFRERVDVRSPVHLHCALVLHPQELAAILGFSQSVLLLCLSNRQRIARQS